MSGTGGTHTPTFCSAQYPHFSDLHGIIFDGVVNLMSSPETEMRFIRQLVVNVVLTKTFISDEI